MFGKTIIFLTKQLIGYTYVSMYGNRGCFDLQRSRLNEIPCRSFVRCFASSEYFKSTIPVGRTKREARPPVSLYFRSVGPRFLVPQRNDAKPDDKCRAITRHKSLEEIPAHGAVRETVYRHAYSSTSIFNVTRLFYLLPGPSVVHHGPRLLHSPGNSLRRESPQGNVRRNDFNRNYDYGSRG